MISNNCQCTTHNIKQLGFSGLRAFVPALAFSSVDKDAARKPNRIILSNVVAHTKTMTRIQDIG